MLFQTLDNKKECYAIYSSGDLYYYPNNLKLTHTWAYTPHFKNNPIEYAQIWAGGKNLSQVCPVHLKEKWEDIEHSAKAFLSSFCEAKINLDDVCFYDLVPKKFLLEYCEIKNKITNYVFEHFKKPPNYDFMLDLVKLVQDIEKQKLNIQVDNLDYINVNNRKILNKIKNSSNHIKYNPWGTATGRLATEKDSFPILTLNKELRTVLRPNNDLFVELDFNAAELRTLFGLTGRKQPVGDIHTMINKHVFDSKYSREESKKNVFAWLYNPKASNKNLSQYIDKNEVIKKYYFDDIVKTPFGRDLPIGKDKALNYLVQSTASDIFLRSALKIHEILKDYKSKIAFCIHDSLVIDFCAEEKNILQEIINVFSDTKYGKFESTLSAGTNFGSMKKII